MIFFADTHLVGDLLQVNMKVAKQEQTLILLLHSHGINIRYLGLVRACLAPSEVYWRSTILIEMIVRTLKQIVRRKMREKMRQMNQTGNEP